MKIFFLIIFALLIRANYCFSQLQIDSAGVDSVKNNSIRNDSAKNDSIKIKSVKTHSIKIESNKFQQLPTNTTTPDSNKIVTTLKIDTILTDSIKLSSKVPERNYQQILNKLLKENKFINVSKRPIFFINSTRKTQGKEYLFYLLSIIILILGSFKVFYQKYFNNVFRVFFNTSLRQNQLTDLLLQARLPSLIFNLFFVIAAGVYVSLLLRSYTIITNSYSRNLLFCILIIGCIYIIKFCVLKFIGWVTGMSDAADTYIFIVFLINKIIGVILLPFIILIAFALPSWLPVIIISSFLILGVLFLLRFLRSYSLLQNQLALRQIPFILYIIAIEILPLLVIYKWVTNII